MYSERVGLSEEARGHSPPLVSPDIAAEAAVWIARLHGPSRTPAMVRECLAWQAQSPAHRLAFERCTETWQEVANLSLSAYANAWSTAKRAPEQRVRVTRPMQWALAAVFLVLASVLVMALQPWRTGEVYATGVGEHRVVMLADGSRMSLNTATKVRARLSSSQRLVEVEAGEVLFEVAKDTSRPFLATAGGTEVKATGTAFLLRLRPSIQEAHTSLEVTLIEGQVVLRPPTGLVAAAVGAGPVVMTAGERVHVDGALAASRISMVRVDRPGLDRALAWTRGELSFDDVTLNEAVDEMNRYSSKPIVIVEAARLKALRVSGLFRTGDSASFARAVAALHGLGVRERSDRLELAPR
ncbi:MAG: iron dicitrate transport regulator FecR [Burkholderiales bacterium PBB2]|nr:MAG: iron dicitrate transport regulator FecR [Burkholderiales bacterium PBB2]